MDNSENNQLRKKNLYNTFLLIVAGLGGLLYGVDVGIIAGALPYLESTSGLNSSQLSIIVAAVLLGSVFGTLFAGMLSDLFGRKNIMLFSGMLFVLSIPIIALSFGFLPLFLGRLLQGASAGLIGVVVPLYLAECLSAKSRGKGTAVFQWLLTLGIVAAAVIGMYFSYRVDEVAKLGNPEKLFAFKDLAWRSIFWVSLPPGILFLLGGFFVNESPRWLFRKGKRDAAFLALCRSRVTKQAELELKEIETALSLEKISLTTNKQAKESLLKAKYVIPFILACIILACNQATGINSIIGYNTNILIQAGLNDFEAHAGSLLFTIINFLATIGAVLLVDKKGRKFLLTLGTSGIIISLICTGIIFKNTEKYRIDIKEFVQKKVNQKEQSIKISGNEIFNLLSLKIYQPDNKYLNSSFILIYSYGGFKFASRVIRTNEPGEKPIEITKGSSLPGNKVIAFFSKPFTNLDKAKNSPLIIENALITPIPHKTNGIIVAIFLYIFMAFFAVGPGVCVWLALSELMPTRIRSNGMSIALLINQAVSTTIAAIFLPTVGKYGYSTMFFIFAGFTVIYLITAAFFLPETKGKTLEEIEEYFSNRKK
jgi:sugar porter (SP) family MFS transporter